MKSKNLGEDVTEGY